MTLIDIQNEVIAKYNITIDPDSHCRRRMHAHLKERKVCKWHQKSSVKATFELFHEIGHIVTNDSKMRRCEQEYHATVWAIEQCKFYGIDIPSDLLKRYQDYIIMERDRGIRRRGSDLPNVEDLQLKGVWVRL